MNYDAEDDVYDLASLIRNQIEKQRNSDTCPGIATQPDDPVVVRVDDLTLLLGQDFTTYMDRLCDLGVLRYSCLIVIPAHRERFWSYPSATEYSPNVNHTSKSLSRVFSHQFELTGSLLGIVDTIVRGTSLARRDLLGLFEVDVGGDSGSRTITVSIEEIRRVGVGPTVEIRSP